MPRPPLLHCGRGLPAGEGELEVFTPEIFRRGRHSALGATELAKQGLVGSFLALSDKAAGTDAPLPSGRRKRLALLHAYLPQPLVLRLLAWVCGKWALDVECVHRIAGFLLERKEVRPSPNLP